MVKVNLETYLENIIYPIINLENINFEISHLAWKRHYLLRNVILNLELSLWIWKLDFYFWKINLEIGNYWVMLETKFYFQMQKHIIFMFPS